MKRTRKGKKRMSAQIEGRLDKDELAEKALLVPTGSTLFNLALSDNERGGFMLGKMINLVGDNSTGKTFLFHTLLAEVARKKSFREWRLIHDDVETASKFDIAKLFGKTLAKRIQPPRVDDDGEPSPSDTVEDWHNNITNCLNEEVPFIYGLDSFDALTSDDERKFTEEKRKAKAKGKKAKGSYGQGKTRDLGAMMRQITRDLEKTKSLLAIISQVRVNLNAGPFSPKYRRTGGQAIGHYVSHEVWFYIIGKIKKNDRVIGVRIKAKIMKNRLTGKIREVVFPLYYDYGVDDIGSCVDFLMENKHWKKKRLTINAHDLKIEGTKEKIIQQIEDKGLERKLQKITGKVWRQIEKKIKLDRKPKYT